MKRYVIFLLAFCFLTFILYYRKDIQKEAYSLIYYSPCNTPIEYSIGTIDPKFGVSKSVLLADTVKAGNIWSTTQNKPLFAYNPNSKFTINLVYDSRQALNTQIDTLNQNLKQQENALNPKLSEYKALEADFNVKLANLNKQIEYWNSRGGAPQSEYDKLKQEQLNLQVEANKLNAMAKDLGQSTDQYNINAQKLNQTINTYHAVLQTKPEEGVYISDGALKTINIYIDTSQTEFLHTLTHEMGHALGLGHNSNPLSIMYPQTTNTLTPTSNDIASLNQICTPKNIITTFVTKYVKLFQSLSPNLRTTN